MPADLGTQKRRAALYARRAASTLPGLGLRRPCVFYHLPKCGGTSLAAGLYGTVPVHRRVGVIDAVSTRRAAAITHFGRDDPVLCHEDLEHGHLTFAAREMIQLSHMAWGTRLIHGHMLVSSKARDWFGSRYASVTMMRDPVSRALSNYRMAVRAGVIPDDIDQWLNGPVGRSMAQVYLRYLSGQNVVPAREQDWAVEIALCRLEWFSLIGFLDQPDLFRDRFCTLFGARPAMPRYNRAPVDALQLTGDQKQRLRQLLAPDQEIYTQARALFARQPVQSGAAIEPGEASGFPLKA